MLTFGEHKSTFYIYFLTAIFHILHECFKSIWSKRLICYLYSL